jgi:hypothetical protein
MVTQPIVVMLAISVLLKVMAPRWLSIIFVHIAEAKILDMWKVLVSIRAALLDGHDARQS